MFGQNFEYDFPRRCDQFRRRSSIDRQSPHTINDERRYAPQVLVSPAVDSQISSLPNGANVPRRS